MKRAKGTKENGSPQRHGQPQAPVKNSLLDGVIEIRGMGEATVEGCLKIEKYEPEEIILKTKGSSVALRGKALCLTSYRTGEVGVVGRIFSVCFTETEDYGRLTAAKVGESHEN